MKPVHLVCAALAASLLASCASGPPRTPTRVLERALAGAPGQAQPGRIVATESAFARAAREDGQWTAFLAFAAPGAVLHGQTGAVPAGEWLAKQDDPPQAVQWAPSEVWMSCDGSLAVSTGRFRDPQGLVGTFVTVWQRQDEGEYRWIYDAGAPDNPQPPAPQDSDVEPGTIKVIGEGPIRGNVADCNRRGEPLPAGVPEGSSYISADRTLAFRWQHVGAGDRVMVATWLHDGGWETALDQTFPAETR